MDSQIGNREMTVDNEQVNFELPIIICDEEGRVVSHFNNGIYTEHPITNCRFDGEQQKVSSFGTDGFWLMEMEGLECDIGMTVDNQSAVSSLAIKDGKQGSNGIGEGLQLVEVRLGVESQNQMGMDESTKQLSAALQESGSTSNVWNNLWRSLI